MPFGDSEGGEDRDGVERLDRHGGASWGGRTVGLAERRDGRGACRFASIRVIEWLGL